MPCCILGLGKANTNLVILVSESIYENFWGRETAAIQLLQMAVCQTNPVPEIASKLREMEKKNNAFLKTACNNIVALNCALTHISTSHDK